MNTNLQNKNIPKIVVAGCAAALLFSLATIKSQYELWKAEKVDAAISIGLQKKEFSTKQVYLAKACGALSKLAPLAENITDATAKNIRATPESCTFILEGNYRGLIQSVESESIKSKTLLASTQQVSTKQQIELLVGEMQATANKKGLSADPVLRQDLVESMPTLIERIAILNLPDHGQINVENIKQNGSFIATINRLIEQVNNDVGTPVLVPPKM